MGRPRKVRDAPKKAMSAYAAFVKEQRPMCNEAHPTLSFGKVAQLVGAMWQKLNKDARTKYAALANQDKLRYALEKREWMQRAAAVAANPELYQHQQQHERKAKKKDKNAPKNPLSAYTCYVREMRNYVASQNVGKTFSEISTLVGMFWRSLDASQRAPYERAASIDRMRYDAEVVKYKTGLAKRAAAESATSQSTQAVAVDGSDDVQQRHQVKPNTFQKDAGRAKAVAVAASSSYRVVDDGHNDCDMVTNINNADNDNKNNINNKNVIHQTATPPPLLTLLSSTSPSTSSCSHMCCSPHSSTASVAAVVYPYTSNPMPMTKTHATTVHPTTHCMPPTLSLVDSTTTTSHISNEFDNNETRPSKRPRMSQTESNDGWLSQQHPSADVQINGDEDYVAMHTSFAASGGNEYNYGGYGYVGGANGYVGNPHGYLDHGNGYIGVGNGYAGGGNGPLGTAVGEYGFDMYSRMSPSMAAQLQYQHPNMNMISHEANHAALMAASVAAKAAVAASRQSSRQSSPKHMVNSNDINYNNDINISYSDHNNQSYPEHDIGNSNGHNNFNKFIHSKNIIKSSRSNQLSPRNNIRSHNDSNNNRKASGQLKDHFHVQKSDEHQGKGKEQLSARRRAVVAMAAQAIAADDPLPRSMTLAGTTTTFENLPVCY